MLQLLDFMNQRYAAIPKKTIENPPTATMNLRVSLSVMGFRGRGWGGVEGGGLNRLGVCPSNVF